MFSHHIELPAQLKPIKASGMPRADPPLLLSRSMSGLAFNAGRHYVVNGEQAFRHYARPGTGRRSRIPATKDGDGAARYLSTVSFRHARPKANIRVAFHEGTYLTLLRIDLDQPFHTSLL